LIVQANLNATVGIEIGSAAYIEPLCGAGGGRFQGERYNGENQILKLYVEERIILV
jgi:hypothetical protein